MGFYSTEFLVSDQCSRENDLAMQLEFPLNHPFHIARNEVSLPRGAFLRALPFTVDETQRFRIDALVLCAEIVASAYVQMIELALRAKWEESKDNATCFEHLDIAMFQHAWSVVDQIYSLHKLLKSLKFQGEDVDLFVSSTETAFRFRNRMDHLDERIPNIAASRNQSRSLFGNLSYIVSGEAVGTPTVKAFLVTQHADPVRPSEKIGSVQIPSELRMPIGNFALSAAGDIMDLDAAILTLGPIMTRTNDEIEKSIRAQVAVKSAEDGIPESKLLTHFGGRLKLMLAVNVDEAPELGKTEEG